MKLTNLDKKKYTVLWATIDWPATHLTQQVFQERLVENYRKQDIDEVYRLQREILQNRNMRLCAIKRVTSNKGGKTPGYNGETLKKPWQKWEASLKLLKWAQSLDTYEAQPVKRVMIQDNGKLRPLGIPTIFDRLTQCMYYQIMDPIVEENSDRNSFGFRLRRDIGDVIQQLTIHLDQPYSATKILDADISKCFEKIDHNAILKDCIVFNKNPIAQWLKAPIYHGPNQRISKSKGLNYRLEQSLIGTPQGGIISPMLCNIVLNGMEGAIEEMTHLTDVTYPKHPNYKLTLIRYADDFVIIAPTWERLELAKSRIEAFLKTKGLDLNKAKTSKVDIKDGFQIVGFWIQKRKYKHLIQKNPIVVVHDKEGVDKDNKLLITIPPQKVMLHKIKIKELFLHRKKLKRKSSLSKKASRNKNTINIINAVNRRVVGWRRNYAKTYASVWQFIDLDRWLTIEKIIPFLRKAHGNKTGKLPWKDVIKRYRQSKKNWKWRIGVEDAKGKLVTFERYYETSQHTELSVLLRKKIPSILRGKVIPDLNPYTEAGRNWWNTRSTTFPRNKANLYMRVLKKYGNKCGMCGFDLGHDGQTTELHRIIPGKDGGQYTLKNVMPVHLFCHKSHHSLINKKERKHKKT